MINLPVVNPYDQTIVRELAYHTGAERDEKVAATKRAFEIWRRVPLEERIVQIRKGLEYFLINADAIAREITQQMGKPILQARREVETFFERAEAMISLAPETLSPERLPLKEGFHRRIEHVPLGVVLNVSAWNYPLLIAVNVVVPALLAGNTVLLKHSALTPLTGRRFEEAFGKLMIPNLVSSLLLSHESTTQLTADPRIAYVAFTGSVDGGRRLYQAVASKRLIDVGLELGGKDPAYVAADADLDFSVANIVDGACFNAGQSCCAVERVYVHKKLYDKFLAKAEPLLRAYRMGDPMDQATTIGPLASRPNLKALEEKVADAKRLGARLLLGGTRTAGTIGNFFPPTLLADVPQEARVMREECFGPVMPVAVVQDDEEAIARMNDTDLGLTASVWTCDRARADHFASELDAGTVYQNRCDYLDPTLPWTGAKDSGKGSTLSKYGFYHLTRRKSVHFRIR